MKFRQLHSWNLSPKEAIELQKKLAGKIVLNDGFKDIKTIAGADMAFTKFDKIGYTGVIVFSFPEFEEIERVSAKGPLTFPYIPGLLSFREAPLLLKAFAKLKIKPDLIMFDGQGIAHPRRIGIASHMGLWLGVPTIGCAKSRLIGKYDEPKDKAGNFSEIYHKGELIGAVLRTRDNVKPVFISPGHMISIKSAIEIAMKCADGLRIPRPTREADHFVSKLRRSNIDIERSS